jgi:hypothetical protein
MHTDALKERLMADPEIEAMSVIADALSGLDTDARSRVLRWAAEKFGVSLQRSSPQGGAAAYQARPSDDGMELDDRAEEVANGASPRSSINAVAVSAAQFDHFAELFDAVHPKSDTEKAVTAGYWEQEVQGHKDWQAQTINNHLKNLGHASSHINVALSSAMKAKPAALVLQLRKSGTSRQARKTYKLTTAGVNFVRTRIAGNA